DTTVYVSLFDSLSLAFHSKLDGNGRDPRFVLATGINPKMVAVNHQCKFPTSHCELSKLRCVGIVLEPPCPRRVDGISIDPEPNWNFDSLLSEIESVEKKLSVFSKFPQPFTQTTLRYISLSLSLSFDSIESDVEEEKDHSQICTKGKHFACDELYLSKMGLAESAPYEVINDHRTKVKEDIKSHVSVAETEMLQELETFRSAIARVEKYEETRKEVECKLDLQYQRKV
ncbi:unnamed protein product, partial [Brassica napus]